MRTNLNALTFGIELETTLPQQALYSNGWRVGGYHNGAAIPGHTGWVAMHDASIHPSRPGHTGVEVVSPVLSGLDGIASVEQMVEKLNALGAAVNKSTGLHVHVGWNGTPEQLRRLICFVAHHEKALLASTGTHSRDSNQYCVSIRAAYARFETDANASHSLLGRYHTLNLKNLDRAPGRRTVEFRVFAGTLNIVKILAYIQLCLGMVQKALDTPRKALPFNSAAIARKRSATIGDGAFALRTLLTALVWREKLPKNGRAPQGVLTLDKIKLMKRELGMLARKYDRTFHNVSRADICTCVACRSQRAPVQTQIAGVA